MRFLRGFLKGCRGFDLREEPNPQKCDLGEKIMLWKEIKKEGPVEKKLKKLGLKKFENLSLKSSRESQKPLDLEKW